MATFAFATVQGGGNLPPQIALGRALAARGHEIQLLGDPAAAPAAVEMGAVFTEIPELSFWQPARPRSVVATIREAVRLAVDPVARERIRQELDRIRPDAVITDPLAAVGTTAARAAGMRTAVLFHTFPVYWTGGFARGPVGLLAAVRGTRLRRLWNDADLRIVTGDPDLDPTPLTPGWLWTGSCETGVPAAQQDPPRILVSLSTTAIPGQPEVYRRVIEAMRSVPARVSVTSGGQILPEDLDLPPNVEVLGRVPHGELMPQMSLVVGHGGYSTTFRALAHGMPLLILPLHPLLDQPLVGRAVAEAGAGITLKPTAPADQIRAAVRRLLDEPAFVDTAQRIGARLRGIDGAAAAADAMETLVAAPQHRV
jgi:UDP:flavonoid glycosyltransferase YjiC (YdhE family)